VTALAPTLEAFFTDRLINQRQASPNTVSAYRHTFRLLLGYLHDRTGTAPSNLDLDDLDEAAIAALEHLEKVRHNSVRTRNARLAAIHSFYAYAALHHPEHAGLIARVLAIPDKRADAATVEFLTDDEVDAILAALDRESTIEAGAWCGRPSWLSSGWIEARLWCVQWLYRRSVKVKVRQKDERLEARVSVEDNEIITEAAPTPGHQQECVRRPIGPC